MIKKLEKFFLFLAITIIEHMVSGLLGFSQLPTDEKIIILLTMYGCGMISMINLYGFIEELVTKRRK